MSKPRITAESAPELWKALQARSLLYPGDRPGGFIEGWEAREAGLVRCREILEQAREFLAQSREVLRSRGTLPSGERAPIPWNLSDEIEAFLPTVRGLLSGEKETP